MTKLRKYKLVDLVSATNEIGIVCENWLTGAIDTSDASHRLENARLPAFLVEEYENLNNPELSESELSDCRAELTEVVSDYSTAVRLIAIFETAAQTPQKDLLSPIDRAIAFGAAAASKGYDRPERLKHRTTIFVDDHPHPP